MKSSSRNRLRSSAAVACLIGLAVHTAHGQSFYSVQKTQNFVQTSSAGSVADPSQAFGFGASGASAATVTFPTGGTQVLTKLFPGDSDFNFEQSFATKAELDAAFPAGTYRMTGTGISTLNFNLTADAYPVVTPQVTNGTWNSGGILVVNPAQSTTITFNTFTGYATSGVAGHMSAEVRGTSDNVQIGGDNSGILSVSNPFGITVSTTPLTSITIPAGALTSGRLYQGAVQFETATTFDTTAVPGGGVVALFSKSLSFFIAAQATGTTTPPPVFVGQPASVVGVLGGTASFSINVTVGGSPQFSNVITRWYFNGREINIDGNKYTFNTNSNGITVRNLTAADVGSYSVTIVNAGGIATSNAATLTLAVAATPLIAQQPVAKNVGTGSTAVFSVVASGTPTPIYQWRKDGVNVVNGANGVTGGTSATLVIQGANAITAGSYSVVVTNGTGTVTSGAATLTVTPTNDPGRLTNLSVLTTLSSRSDSFSLGYVVSGASATNLKPLVIRAAGPSLGALGFPGTLDDPKLELFAGPTKTGENEDWGGSAATAAAMAAVGGFAYVGPTSRDAAVAANITSSDNSVKITVGANSVTGTGAVIAEVYDATPTNAITASTPRLVNFSVIKPISAGGSLTLGFTLGGSVAKTVLVRAVGPGLAAVGVTSGTLGDPQLTLFNSASVAIATNDDWGADPQLTNAGARVGAFNIGSAQSKDAMLIITLPAGGYTARVTGGSNTSGLAIVEVYEVP